MTANKTDLTFEIRDPGKELARVSSTGEVTILATAEEIETAMEGFDSGSKPFGYLVLEVLRLRQEVERLNNPLQKL